MALSTVISSTLPDPLSLNFAIIGKPGVGKTRLASNFGSKQELYFAATENGTKYVRVLETAISQWSDFETMVKELLTTEHPHKHLVIDTMDNLVKITEDHIKFTNKVKNMSDVPYGGAYSQQKSLLFGNFKKLNDKGMGLTFITHAQEKEYKSDEGISWTSMGTSLGGKLELQLVGLCDVALFCYKKSGTDIVKIRTRPTKNIECAKDRSGKLPELIDMDLSKPEVAARLLMDSLKK